MLLCGFCTCARKEAFQGREIVLVFSSGMFVMSNLELSPNVCEVTHGVLVGEAPRQSDELLLGIPKGVVIDLEDTQWTHLWLGEKYFTAAECVEGITKLNGDHPGRHG